MAPQGKRQTMFVIWNITQRKYVAPPGLQSSFTNKLQNARRFSTREAAEADCCGNERVVEA